MWVAPGDAAAFEERRRAWLAARPLTIRTLDIGGDKYVSYLDLPGEANPFLGRRGLRLCLDHPDLFKQGGDRPVDGG